MRSEPAEFELAAPGVLADVLELLAREPGAWLPIAGGTDVMVLYGAGKLSARRLVSLWNLPELRRIDVEENEITIGAGATYTDLRAQIRISRTRPDGDFVLLNVNSPEFRKIPKAYQSPCRQFSGAIEHHDIGATGNRQPRAGFAGEQLQHVRQDAGGRQLELGGFRPHRLVSSAALATASQICA